MMDEDLVIVKVQSCNMYTIFKIKISNY
uniref:Uncharacterized protein n=1 Tax=Lepeophtheirus salmonis TaxID=72036 RepID=A0A0K2T4A9_LEPSM